MLNANKLNLLAQAGRPQLCHCWEAETSERFQVLGIYAQNMFWILLDESNDLLIYNDIIFGDTEVVL